MASTNTTSIGYDKETVPGTTNDTPDFQLLPVLSNSLISNLTTAVSDVIRDDRQTDDLVVTDAEVSGDIGFELSYAPWKPLIVSLLQGDGVGVTIAEETGVSSVNAASTFGILGIETGRSVGDSINVTSATDPDIDGVYVITTVATDLLTVTPAPATDQADCVLKETITHANGAEVADSYTFRSIYKNDAGTNHYFYERGCQISTMNLSFATGSILTGSMSVVGLTELATLSAIAGETTVVIPPYSILNSVTSIGAISIGGVSTGTCKFNSMNLTVDNNINQAKSISVLGACSLASFALNITGTIEIYFDNLDAYTKFKDSASFTVAFALLDVDGNMIGVSMQKCKFESLSHPVSGKDAFLMESGSFRALRDTVSDSMIQFTFSDA